MRLQCFTFCFACCASVLEFISILQSDEPSAELASLRHVLKGSFQNAYSLRTTAKHCKSRIVKRCCA